MSQPDQPNPTPDDLLADFTDRMLEGETSVASAADEELRGLEETVLRLEQSLPHAAPDAKTIRRMQADFKVRARKTGASSSPTWQFLRPRQRLTLAFAGVALALILIAFPFLPLGNEPLWGTAGVQPQAVILLVGIVAVVVLLIWAGRRN